MNNKEFMRRAASFAVSLSFISYSGIADIYTIEATDTEKITMSAGSTAVTTSPVSTPAATTENTSVSTTAPVTSTVPGVTTEAINYLNFYLDIDKNINLYSAKLIAKSLFDGEIVDVYETENISKDFLIKIKETSANKDRTLEDYIMKNNIIKRLFCTVGR